MRCRCVLNPPLPHDPIHCAEFQSTASCKQGLTVHDQDATHLPGAVAAELQPGAVHDQEREHPPVRVRAAAQDALRTIGHKVLDGIRNLSKEVLSFET